MMFGFMGFGWLEMTIAAGIALLLFGHRLPGAMRSLGQGITEFKKGMNETIEDDSAGSASEEKLHDEHASKP